MHCTLERRNEAGRLQARKANASMTVALALLIMRVVAGLTLSAHGVQKLGWFGGPGFTKVEQGFDAMGYRPARLWVTLAVVGELGGGLSLLFGFLTPLGAAGAVGAMVVAISTHWKNGFFGAKGGYEYPLALLAMSLAVGVAGAGALSLDALLKIALPAPLFGALALAALIVDAVGILLARAAASTAAKA
jgi:putative oxidoreductase